MIELIILIGLAVFALSYYYNNGENVYKFFVTQVSNAYEKYAYESLKEFVLPASKVLLADVTAINGTVGTWLQWQINSEEQDLNNQRFMRRHNGKMAFNLTYVDGHARTMRYNGTGIYDDGSFYQAAKKAPVVQYR